jgi:methylmalonyl-CoA mutase N-terminal domain/subunit
MCLPTEESVRIALRTQQIIAYETGVANTVDPLGGSYAVEHLTDEIERRARATIDAIDAMGGAVAAIEQAYYQQEIAEAAYRYQQAVERNERLVVGVNAYRAEDETVALDRSRVDPAVEERQRKRLAELRARRDGERASAALGRIEAAARTRDDALMPLFVEAVEADCTLGEVCGVLRGVWGEYRPGQGL